MVNRLIRSRLAAVAHLEVARRLGDGRQIMAFALKPAYRRAEYDALDNRHFRDIRKKAQVQLGGLLFGLDSPEFTEPIEVRFAPAA
jgi:hypothetical protein